MNGDDHTVTNTDQDSWRLRVLQGILWVFMLVGLPAVAFVMATNSRGLTRPATLIALILMVIVVLVMFSPRWPFNWRALILIGVTYAYGLIGVLFYGFTLGPGLLLLLVVVLSGLFFGSKWLWVGLLITSTTLASVGALHATGSISTLRLDLLDFSQGQTVVRAILAYLVLAGTIAVSMSYIVSRIERSLYETSEVLARYEAERRGRTTAEAALRESETSYRQLVEDINDVIYSTDAEGVITYMSPAVECHSGYPASEFIGHHFSTWVYEADRARILREFKTTLSGQLEPSEYRVVIKGGEIRWIRSSSRPIYRDGEVAGLRGLYIDITEKRELEEQLRQTHKMEAIGTLAGGIAHEFNNALSAILGFTDLTLREVPENGTAWTHLQYVKSAGYRAKDLVQQILVFSRQSEPTREPLFLPQVIQDAFPLLRAALPTTIGLQLNITDEVGMVMANSTQFYQILMNLCSNAEYAMRETGGVITLNLDTLVINSRTETAHPDLTPGVWLRLSVGDTGGGIPAEMVDRIFDPFFTTKGIGEGTGMGLAIVHSIVASHGGCMTVHSQPTEGTTFTLYFPQISECAAEAPEPFLEELRQGEGRILFVDDEEMLARLGQRMLEHLGYEVVAHTNSLDALREFQADPDGFDAVITDQTMPVMTGASLVQELRQIRPDIPIILCTGFSHSMDAEKARDLGVDGFVMKPGVTHDLALMLQQVFDKHANRKM